MRFRAIEAAVLVRLGGGLDIGSIEHRPAGRVNLGTVLRADEANEFDAHGAASGESGLRTIVIALARVSEFCSGLA